MAETADDPGRFCCPHCKSESVPRTELIKSSSYYLSFNIEEQLRSLLEDQGLGVELNYRFSRPQRESCLSDIYDGRLYREFKEGKLLSNQLSLSFTMNTDGVPAFKSSNTSVWPILCFVNELPPALRKKHMILCGLWFGSGKPNANGFLRDFVGQLKDLSINGFKWTLNNKVVTSTVDLLAVCVDSVARAPVQNFVQFNGYNGCSWCLEPGKRAADANVHVYPYNDRLSLRTKEDVQKHAERAEKEELPIYGVRGKSVLSELPYFDIVFNMVFDCMHAIDLGVVRQLFSLWFDSKNCKEKFYFGTTANKKLINTRLAQLYVPTNITRLPRSLKESSYWKASEWRNCLLYYFPYILKDILPPKYYQHFMLLSEAAYILNGPFFTHDDVRLASKRLENFVKDFCSLYRECDLSFNCHILLHAAECVYRWGPLWAYSAYGFEDCNGQLLKLFNGTQHINLQMANNFLKRQQLKAYTFMYFNEETNVNLVNLQKRMLGGYVAVKKAVRNKDSILMGCPSATQLTTEQQYLIRSCFDIDYDCGLSFPKMINNNDVYTVYSYQRSDRRKNCFVLIQPGIICRLSSFFLLGDDACSNIKRETIIFGECLKHVTVSSPSHLFQLVKINYVGQLLAFKPNDILAKCVMMNKENDIPNMYLSVLTNMLDRD